MLLAASVIDSLPAASVEQGEGDNLATARVALLCDVVQVVKTDLEVHSFLNKHPKAYYIKFDDFHCLEFKVKTIRYIGGFGEVQNQLSRL